MSQPKELQRVSIVFEETGEEGKDANGNPGRRFNVYLSGQQRNLAKVAESEMTPAEFWAYRCFAIVGQVITQSGVVEKAFPMPDGGVPH